MEYSLQVWVLSTWLSVCGDVLKAVKSLASELWIVEMSPGASLWRLYPPLIPGWSLCFLVCSNWRILHHTLPSPAAPATPFVPWWMKTSWQWPKTSPSSLGCLRQVFGHNIKVTNTSGLSKESKICLALKNQSVDITHPVKRMKNEKELLRFKWHVIMLYPLIIKKEKKP